MKRQIFFLSFIFGLAIATQYAPIPSVPDGLSQGGNSSTLKLKFEAFFDLMCPDSKGSYAILKPLLPKILANDQFQFTIHFFPLVFHREAYTMSEAVHYIKKTYGNEKALEFIDLIFTNQESFGTPETYNKTRFEVEDEVAQLVLKNLNLNTTKDVYLTGVRESANDEASRVSWKFGCSKGVTGTPIFFANGVKVDGAEAFDAKGFTDFFNQYLGGAKKEFLDVKRPQSSFIELWELLIKKVK